MRSIERWLLLAMPLAVAACNSGSSATPSAGGKSPGGGGPGGGPGGPRGDQVRPVEVTTLTTGTLARQSTLAGALEPLRTIGVNAQIGGALESVRVEEGT